MIEITIVIAVMLILTAMANSEMDTIAHRKSMAWINKPFVAKIVSKFTDVEKFANQWYLANNWRGHTWFRKTIFSFTLDGWHFWKAIRVYSYSVVFTIAFMLNYGYGTDYLWAFLIAWLIYGLNGAIFEFFYQDYLGI